MNCHGVKRHLSAYADERIDTKARKAAIALHLSACDNCRASYADLREMRAALLGAERIQAPAEFSGAWRNALRRESLTQGKPAPKPVWTARLRWAIPAAACLVLALGLAVRLTGEIRRPVPGLEKQRLLSLAPEPKASEKAAPREASAKQRANPGEQTPSVPMAGQEENDSAGAGPSSSDRSGQTGEAAPTITRSASTEAPVAPRAGLTAATPGTDTAPRNDTAVTEGTWRVWLTSVGIHQAPVARALIEANVLPRAAAQAAVDVPMLLREGLSYTEAQRIAQAVEEAGGHATVELMSR